MSTHAASRTLILQRIRAACGAPTPDSYAELPRDYIRRGSLSAESRIALMTERLREYGAEVTTCAPDDIASSLATLLRASGRASFATAVNLPGEWRAAEFLWMLDGDLTADQLEKCGGVVTTAFAGIADSGTIVLHHDGSEGRRCISLLPDWHLCILRTSQVVETLPEYFDLCRQSPALATFISGPSATADIEMTRIKGVHGPRFLSVLLVHDQNQPQSEPLSTHKNTGRQP